MGAYTINNYFYKPALGASGQSEMDTYDGALDTTDGIIKRLADHLTITTITTTHTMTVAEAGTVLVSASSAYTITLPTAVGNQGLIYHFIKTDSNYNLITIDGDGTETINYENSTGAPCLTYLRVNTHCAEVTMTSDNANWQVSNEQIGQVPYAYIYTSADMLDLVSALITPLIFDTETTDTGSNFNSSTWISGTATATSANHLVDTTNNQFTAHMVGWRIKNTTDTTYAYITAYNSTSDVTVSSDIFVDGEGYELPNSKFVVPVSGYYGVKYSIRWKTGTVVADKVYDGFIYKEVGTDLNSIKSINNVHSSNTGYMMNGDYVVLHFDAGSDEITIKARQTTGVDTVDIGEGDYSTYVVIRLISKD